MARTTAVTRRGFLKAAGSSAFAAPLIVSPSVLGLGGTTPPSERIVMGAVGVGGMGRGNLGAFMGSSDVQMVAVCDVFKPHLDDARNRVESKYAEAKAGGTWKGCQATADFREVVARPDIDAVCISTPDHWHAPIAIAAARNGKDMYCEKPMSLTIRGARAMVDTMRRYGRVFQTGSQQRSSREFRFACEMVRSGRIGRITHINVNVGGPSRGCFLPPQETPPGMDWDRWLGPAPWRPYNSGLHPFSWRSFRDYSGGQMTDWGAHHFDIAQWGLGMSHSGPVEIVPPDGKDVKLLTYRYADGTLVYHGGGGNGVVFHGTDGKIEVNRGHLRTWPAELQTVPMQPGEVHLYRSRSHRGDFLDCVRSRRRPICDVEVGCRSVSVCHLGNIAYWLKRPIRWNPDTEEIIGDAEASRWLDRPRRAPWSIV